MFRSLIRGRPILLPNLLKNAKPRQITHTSPRFQKNRYWSYAGFRGLTLLGFIWPFKWGSKEKVEVPTPETLDVGIKDADRYFDEGQFSECYETLKILQTRNPDNVEILWRISRALFQLASAPKTDGTTKKKLATEAYEAVTEALKLDDNNFAVHKWMSVVLDLKSTCEGTTERIKNLETVKKHMLRAVEINPSDATTLYMLGKWCYGLADLPWYQRRIAQTLFAKPPESSFEEALKYFRMAETVEPNFYSMNWLMLGKTHLKLGNNSAAAHFLSLARSYPARTNDDHEAKKEAQELLKNLS